ncbi:hypothetical protein HYC85_028088 [Camellia sinensis]|uniref:Glycosyl hydrolase family 32 N-terminal domain-containing protein n=1 Tax=Camellia sinensis TaxID=4442 RepID=A0A7J7FUW7_CAMSI|nr:hypothetical protein HYC85_028088 [Camellia sinensis]
MARRVKFGGILDPIRFWYYYNPDGADWGNIVWAHSTSLDLVNWTPHPPAISPSQHGGDINGCWSGSTTILLDGKPVILYTGVDSQNRQVQVLAMPKNISDPLLIEWVKSPLNPLMAPTTMNKINASSFRDPTTAWLGPDGRWRVIIGSKINRRGLAILYTSKDFVHWIKSQHPLHFAENSGMWECPDFFPVSTDSQSGVDTSMVGLGIKDVLKLSLDETKHDYYTIGTYNRDKDIYIPDKGSVDNDSGLRYDYGKFYASKTFYDSVKQLRILWGWINESLPQPEYVKQGWSGVQAIPRRIWLDKSRKQLVQWPISEIEMLRTNQADVEISFEVLEIEKAEIIDPSWTNPQLLSSLNQNTDKTTYGAFVEVDPTHEQLSLRSLRLISPTIMEIH